MKNPLSRAVLCAVAALAAAAAHAQAPDKSPLDDRHDVTLDIDQDGKPDRASLLRNRDTNDLDLVIEPSSWNSNPQMSRRLAFTKKAIASGLVLEFVAKGKSSLVITTGCGGCSNDVSTTLTIVHRGRDFVVAGYTLAWDTRTGSGTCDVNFLTGKGTLSRNGSKTRPLTGRFAPIKVDDWSNDNRPKECE
jgi:hypothetical protein